MGASDSGGVCQCPLGFVGEFCEQPVEVRLPRFNGTSHLTYFGMGSMSASASYSSSSIASSASLSNDVEVVFKAEEGGGEDGRRARPGILLYNGDREGRGEAGGKNRVDGVGVVAVATTVVVAVVVAAAAKMILDYVWWDNIFVAGMWK